MRAAHQRATAGDARAASAAATGSSSAPATPNSGARHHWSQVTPAARKMTVLAVAPVPTSTQCSSLNVVVSSVVNAVASSGANALA